MADDLARREVVLQEAEQEQIRREHGWAVEKGGVGTAGVPNQPNSWVGGERDASSASLLGKRGRVVEAFSSPVSRRQTERGGKTGLSPLLKTGDQAREQTASRPLHTGPGQMVEAQGACRESASTRSSPLEVEDKNDSYWHAENVEEPEESSVEEVHAVRSYMCRGTGNTEVYRAAPMAHFERTGWPMRRWEAEGCVVCGAANAPSQLSKGQAIIWAEEQAGAPREQRSPISGAGGWIPLERRTRSRNAPALGSKESAHRDGAAPGNPGRKRQAAPAAAQGATPAPRAMGIALPGSSGELISAGVGYLPSVQVKPESKWTLTGKGRAISALDKGRLCEGWFPISDEIEPTSTVWADCASYMGTLSAQELAGVRGRVFLKKPIVGIFCWSKSKEIVGVLQEFEVCYLITRCAACVQEEQIASGR
ncbi:hypothetical protein B484DRAFT_466934 [Ochromonadaceae sp. CCMP2298]|nr:hypothetical protein B484DRAFT_466934 [Ochromonadaceae sp. CCMP2298]